MAGWIDQARTAIGGLRVERASREATDHARRGHASERVNDGLEELIARLDAVEAAYIDRGDARAVGVRSAESDTAPAIAADDFTARRYL